MKVGILDILVDSPRTWINFAYRGVLRKQDASIMPQAVSAWCRQLCHWVAYATYYGQHDPMRLLPDDPQIVFLSAYTQSSALAYALAKCTAPAKPRCSPERPFADLFGQRPKENPPWSS